MSDRYRLREILDKKINLIDLADSEAIWTSEKISELADHILADGWIRLPCKVGDTVYRFNRHVWADECDECEHFRVGGFGDPNRCGRTEDGLKHPDCIKIEERVATQHDILFWLCHECFGKIVFLTREEAEQALKERKEK